MKKHLPILLIISIFAFCFSSVKASILGGEIYYDHISNDTFKVTVVVYRDCNEGSITALPAVLTSGCGTTNITLTAMPAVDITPVCDGDISRCSNPASTFPYGIQKLEFSGIFTVDNNCCNYKLSWSGGNRSSIITTGSSNSPFYIYANFDACMQNNSPKFNSDPLTIACIGNCIEYNFSVTDMENDSLVFELTPPLQNASTPVVYTAPYSFDKPLQFDGFPNVNSPSHPFCRGFHLNRGSGELNFKPTQVQNSNFAVMVKEFRNGVKIGEVVREMTVININCPANDPPVISGINNTTVFETIMCSGQNLTFDIFTSDVNTGDSVTLSWGAEIPGATFTITPGQFPTGTFSWTPSISDVSSAYYTFTITAMDNNCSNRKTTVKTFKILVHQQPVALSISDSTADCGLVYFDAVADPSSATVTWEIDNLTFENQNSVVHRFDQSGNQTYQTILNNNGCISTYNNSVNLNFTPLIFTLGNDVTACVFDNLLLQPQIMSGNGGYQYLWLNDSSTAVQKNITVTDNPVNYILKITESTGCFKYDTIKIINFPVPEVIFTNIPDICQNSPPLNLFSFASPAGGTWSGTGVTSNLFYPSSATTGTNTVFYTLSDIYGCNIPQPATINVLPFPSVTAGNDTALCKNSGLYLLQPHPLNGTWGGNAVSAIVNNSHLDPSLLSQGNYILTYHYNTANCSFTDTMHLSILPAPYRTINSDYNICKGSSLQLSVTGGVSYSWSPVTGLSDPNISNPVATPANSTTYNVNVTDNEGCSETFSVNINIISVNINAGDDLNLCKNGTTHKLTPSPTGGTWQGSASAAMTGNDINPSLLPLGNYQLIYVFKYLNCTEYDTISVKINNKPVVNISKDTFICQGTSIQLNASGGNLYHWSPGTHLNNRNIASPSATPQTTTTYTVNVTNASGCMATSAVTVKVDAECVLPGDANYDKEINNFDLLNVGLAYGKTGHKRPNISINLVEQPADNWNQNFINGINYKHADCNGDGIVNNADVSAILQNYNFTPFKNSIPLTGNPAHPELSFSVSSNEIYPGDPFEIIINFGTQAVNAHSVYGAAFTLNYEPNTIKPGTTTADISNSWLDLNNNLIWLVKDFPHEGKTDVAISRINQLNNSGWGEIIKLNFTIDDNIPGNISTLNFSLSDLFFIDNNGITLNINKTNSESVILSSEIISEWYSNIKIYPNPAQTQVIINTKGINISHIKLINNLGQEILLNAEKTDYLFLIEISDLSKGMYYLHLESEEGVAVKKLLKN